MCSFNLDGVGGVFRFEFHNFGIQGFTHIDAIFLKGASNERISDFPGSWHCENTGFARGQGKDSR